MWYVHNRVCVYTNDSTTKLLYYICMYECIGEGNLQWSSVCNCTNAVNNCHAWEITCVPYYIIGDDNKHNIITLLQYVRR